MFFIIQNDKEFNRLDIELEVLKQELNKQKYIHNYIEKSIDYFDDDVVYPESINIKEAVPVGSIEFVSRYLKKIHNIDNLNPLEIPQEMRIPKFLLRDYKIVESKDIPKKGYYFIKDVSELKYFTYIGEMEYFLHDDIFGKPKSKFDTKLYLNPHHLFEVSEVVNILSEYRVFVSNDKIMGIQFYDGDPTIMPTPDEINKIKEAILRYQTNKTRPRAYALDIAIIKQNNELGRDLMIIESCPFASLGTYGLVGSFLPHMYKAGIDWYIEHNTKIEKFNGE